MAIMAAPVMAFVLVYAGYPLMCGGTGRATTRTARDPRQHRISATWIGSRQRSCGACSVFGTVELVVPAGAGAGEGNTRSGGGRHPLQVQVIAQQWRFTYRYPSSAASRPQPGAAVGQKSSST